MNEPAVPFVAFGNDELRDKPSVNAGDEITCPHCDQKHTLRSGKDADGNATAILLCYTCPSTGSSYLAAIDHKLIMDRFKKGKG